MSIEDALGSPSYGEVEYPIIHGRCILPVHTYLIFHDTSNEPNLTGVRRPELKEWKRV